MICFYHSDNDGKCAGYWVKEIARIHDKCKYPFQLFKIDYGIPFPFEMIHKDESVYIVDYSIEPSEMDKLLTITENVTWIDHHISAIEKYRNYDKEIRGLRYNGIAGCMLTYCFLACMVNVDTGEVTKEFDPEMVESAPYFTKLIADYDVWTFEYGDHTRFFQKGFTLYPNEPDEEIWKMMYEEDLLFPRDRKIIKRMIDQGRVITEYRNSMMKDYCDKKGFVAVFDDYKNCYALNMGMVGSDDFVIENPDQYDILIGFSFDGELWTYSLRSNNIDVSKVAAKYGGGGHKAAAGFNSKTLLLKAANKKEG